MPRISITKGASLFVKASAGHSVNWAKLNRNTALIWYSRDVWAEVGKGVVTSNALKRKGHARKRGRAIAFSLQKLKFNRSGRPTSKSSVRSTMFIVRANRKHAQAP